MPEPPGWINEFQFITKFFFNRCHHPWTLYFEMAFPPTVHAADVLLAVDLPQIARTLFRPGGRRTKRHGRKRKGTRRPPYTKVPDPNESVAALIRDATEVGERQVSDGVRQLWQVLDIGESVIGKLFILGITEQWLYEYALYIDASHPSDCGIAAVRGEGGGDLTQPGTIGTIGGTDAVWATGGASCANGTVFMPAERWIAVCSGYVKNVGTGLGTGTTITVHIGVDDGTGHINASTTVTKTLDYLEQVDFITTAFFNNGEATGCFWLTEQNAGGHSRAELGSIVIFCQAY